MKLIQMVSQICDDRIAFDIFDLSADNFADPSILSHITNLAPKFTDTMVLCKLLDRWTNCDQFLFPMITEEGLCYSFNMLNMNELVSNE